MKDKWTCRVCGVAWPAQAGNSHELYIKRLTANKFHKGKTCQKEDEDR